LSVLRPSPDGLRFALFFREGENERTLKVFPVTGGEVGEVHRFKHSGGWVLDMAWSRDGRYLYFVKKVDQDKDGGPYELWRVPAGGGNAQKIGVTANRIGSLNIHPDGKRIIFQSSPAGEQAGAVWAMENFLAKD
jgi:TolB protein